jgi:hypothetical protein
MSQYYEIRVFLFISKNKFRLSLKQIGFYAKKEKNFAFTYILTISPLYTLSFPLPSPFLSLSLSLHCFSFSFAMYFCLYLPSILFCFWFFPILSFSLSPFLFHNSVCFSILHLFLCLLSRTALLKGH